MGIRIRSRCGKRQVPLTANRRADGKAAPAVRTEIRPDGAVRSVVRVNGKKVLDIHHGTAIDHDGAHVVEHGAQGEVCAPRSALTVFIRGTGSAKRSFFRMWKCQGVKLRRLMKDRAPLSDARGDAYSADGPAGTLERMLQDTRIGGHVQISVPRDALGSGKHCRKPTPKAGARPPERLGTYRVIDGSGGRGTFTVRI